MFALPRALTCPPLFQVNTHLLPITRLYPSPAVSQFLPADPPFTFARETLSSMGLYIMIDIEPLSMCHLQ